MTLKQSALPNCLLGVAIVCFVLSLFPYGGSHTDPETDEQVTEWSVGLPFSPLWKYTQRGTPPEIQVEMGIHFLSWSWIPLVVSSLCLRLRRHHRQMLVNAPADESSGS